VIHEQGVCNHAQMERELSDSLGCPRLALSEQWGLAMRAGRVRLSLGPERATAHGDESLPLTRRFGDMWGPTVLVQGFC
jgi:hypothetical protein